MGTIINFLILFLRGTVLGPIADGVQKLIADGASFATVEELAIGCVTVAGTLYPAGHAVFDTLPNLIDAVASTTKAATGAV